MHLIINADDYGRSNGINKNILKAFDNSFLNSASLPVNGHGVEAAKDEYFKRSNFRLALHIDLIEGKPLLPKEKLADITDKNGFFYLSFALLWLKYFLANNNLKSRMREQIKSEIKAQILKYIDLFDFKSINIDSHQHMHMVPFVFDILIELKNEFAIDYIRLPSEKFFFSFDNLNSAIRSYLGPNLIKHFLLRSLCGKYAVKMREKSIKYSDHFIGVLFTGYMTKESVVKAINQVISDKKSTVEVLFHICKAEKGEENLWNRLPGLKKYYFSSFRDHEISIFKDEMLKKFINNIILKA